MHASFHTNAGDDDYRFGDVDAYVSLYSFLTVGVLCRYSVACLGF